jgi:hypothetical protein
MSEAFVIQRSRPIALALAANLGRIARAGSATFVGRSTEPGAAVIIGGGPSCGGFERIPHGALSICVNTSAPKVCESIAPDVLVIREVVPAVRELADLKHAPKCIVLDVQTSPVTVARAHDVAPVLWAIPAQSVIAWLPRLLDVEPVYAGESAMNMAVALATRWGCDRQSLIGCDLAFGPDGTAYGDGTAWDGCKVTADGVTVDFGSTREVMQANARAGGIPPTLHRETATPVLREDGTSGLALATWISQRVWVEQWARRHPGLVTANLSGGARIEGWPASERVARSGRDRFGRDVPRVTVDTSTIAAEVRRQVAHVRAMVDHEAPWRMADAVSGCPLIDLAAAKEVLETSYRSLPLKVALAERRPILLRAADAVEAAFEG